MRPVEVRPSPFEARPFGRAPQGDGSRIADYHRLMFGIHDLALYLLATVLLAVTPGPDTALVFAQSLRHGARGGIVAALGVATGCLVHITAASIGLSAVLAASAMAFNVIKWLGAAYLAFIGLRAIIMSGRSVAAAPAADPLARKAGTKTSSVFWSGGGI